MLSASVCCAGREPEILSDISDIRADFVIDEGGRAERGIFEQTQRRFQDRVLSTRVVRSVQGIAVAEGNEQRTGRPDSLGHLAQQLDRHRRDSLSLHLGCDQTDRLVAERSDGNEERDVHPISDQLPRGVGRRVADQAPRCHDRAHEGEVAAVD